ncbi:uncharacterized protein CTHT_0065420 [Thermochaetoides thermophila DSM 1495]|uniref:Uncharacterized protein n=1 Tax=Chaetomium thermophilum (strain DSM 1495 / CBS 144.50 / IMI 039719) TaxID=759272 RepID=G0SG85_CHATD|nr:hypothetical protein CTHT_0065420 [Thermochaetoides thermophila DSM 1495]EGS17224.1 hypothetical protein CTHT_0065420 [Thermochaetoides thermophila DSM 1495]
MRTETLYAGLLSLAAVAAKADPTWPSEVDHMEFIVYQLQGFKGSLFNDAIRPCDNEAAGPGRITASEWLRVAFHDMSTHNKYTGVGGLDASIQFELNNGENTGPGHRTSLEFYANYLTSRSSMADLIAAGVYASVRSCGGPVVPLRVGRKDATAAGPLGVPQPQNSVVTFRQQFDRMGFTSSEMIQLVACGHTLGSVHSAEFPNIVNASVGQIGLDSSNHVYDNKVVTEYLDGTTTNPLVVGPAVGLNRHSDFKVFNSDGNATISAMADPNAYREICRTVLQKMIEVVPPGVTLTDPVEPYNVKPVDIKLKLNNGASTLQLTGYIRLRANGFAMSDVSNVVLTWKDRWGGSNCGSSGCSTTLTLRGVASGLDDNFGFFPIDVAIPAAYGISSFTLVVNFNDGTSQSYDNNGHSYPVDDAIILQIPQSCLLQTSGSLTVRALVRNDIADVPVNLDVEYLTPRTTGTNPVPILSKETIPMTEGDCAGLYTFYEATFAIPGGMSYNARVSVSAGEHADTFIKGSDLGGSCATFSGGLACGNVTEPEPATSTSSIASSTSVPVTSASSSTSDTATASPTPAHKSTIEGYQLVGCWTEGIGARALGGAAFAYDGMTLESCMANCTGFDYWGTEYGRECYCGNSLHSTSSEAPLEDCNMPCSGDATEYCGAGNRLELYSTTATRTTTATPTPTGALAHKPAVGDYVFVGCQTEASGGRALSGAAHADDSMTLELCASLCSGFIYFGTEYGRECYCGNSLNAGSTEAPLSECNMVCAGDQFEYCGAGNRLDLYVLANAPTVTANPTTTAAPSHQPTASPFAFVGCWTEGTTGRTLSDKTFASGDMTVESCAAFCDGYKYFGVEYSSECYCGNTINPTSSEAPSLNDCNMLCSGNPSQYCGGPSRLDLYENEDVIAPTTPSSTSTPSTPTQPSTVIAPTAQATWSSKGCYTEATGMRALSEQTLASDNLTLEMCAEFCNGYQFFGTEYSRECYCGNVLNTGSVEVSDGDCSMPCAGDTSQLCGAGNRLSVYEVQA